MYKGEVFMTVCVSGWGWGEKCVISEKCVIVWGGGGERCMRVCYG